SDRALQCLDRHRTPERVLDGTVNYRHSSRSDLLDDAAVADALEHGTQRSVTGLLRQNQCGPRDFETQKLLEDRMVVWVDGGVAEKSSIIVDSLPGTPYKHTPSADLVEP